MLKENLIKLRNFHGYTQEKIAETIGISRQAYERNTGTGKQAKFMIKNA